MDVRSWKVPIGRVRRRTSRKRRSSGLVTGMMLAIAVLALVPSLALFGWVQRYLTTGLSAGAVKG